jgi:hypothetical protein
MGFLIGENSPRSVVAVIRRVQSAAIARKIVPQKRERGRLRAHAMAGSGMSRPRRCVPVRSKPIRMATKGRLGVARERERESMSEKS